MKLIVFEGIDNSGKTTLAKATAEGLKAKGCSVYSSFEPFGTDPEKRKRFEEGKSISIRGPEVSTEYLPGTNRLFDLYMYLYSRKEQIKRLDEEEKKGTEYAVLDRYNWSTYAYFSKKDVRDKLYFSISEEILGKQETLRKNDIVFLVQSGNLRIRIDKILGFEDERDKYLLENINTLRILGNFSHIFCTNSGNDLDSTSERHIINSDAGAENNTALIMMIIREFVFNDYLKREHDYFKC